MRLHGYCDECHRFKQVHVPGHGMAMMWDAGEDGEPDREYVYPRQLEIAR